MEREPPPDGGVRCPRRPPARRPRCANPWAVHDSTAAMYAPPAAPPGPPADPRDPLGWALLAIPVAAGGAMALVTSEALGNAISWLSLLATVVLIAVDAKRRGQPAGRHAAGAVLLWIVFYPLYMHRRAAWGAPRRLGLALFATAAFLAGALARPAWSMLRPPRATVLCQPVGQTLGEGVRCTLRSESASDDLKVCWDVDVQCGPQSIGSAKRCGRVKPDQPTEVVIPLEELYTGLDSCATPVRIQPSNVRVDIAQ